MKGIKEYENKSVEGRDINLEYGSASPLGRKGRGSHPVLGSGLKQRDEQREEDAVSQEIQNVRKQSFTRS